MEWMPIETAPRDGSRILFWDGVCVKVGRWVDTSYDEDKLVSEKGNRRTYETVRITGGYWDIDEYELWPDLWMPAPPPPTAHEQIEG